LEAFKAELNQPTIKPAFETRQTATEQQPDSDKLVHQSGEIAEFGEIATVDKLASIIESLLSKGDNRPAVAIADKLILTIAEVQMLTGLSKELLRDAITAGELKAKVIGKGWRVKRSDLQEYIDKLF
jgi:excisionase family DNA binding protein